MNDILFNVGYGHFLVLAAVLFLIGVGGVLVRRNALIILMSVELMLNAANMTLLAFARMWGDMLGPHASRSSSSRSRRPRPRSVSRSWSRCSAAGATSTSIASPR